MEQDTCSYLTEALRKEVFRGRHEALFGFAVGDFPSAPPNKGYVPVGKAIHKLPIKVRHNHQKQGHSDALEKVWALEQLGDQCHVDC